MVTVDFVHRACVCRVMAYVVTLLAVAGCALISKNVASEGYVQPQRVITMDASYLELAKTRLVAGDGALKVAYDKLLQDAKIVLEIIPESVSNKKLVPPSGNKTIT